MNPDVYHGIFSSVELEWGWRLRNDDRTPSSEFLYHLSSVVFGAAAMHMVQPDLISGFSCKRSESEMLPSNVYIFKI